MDPAIVKRWLVVTVIAFLLFNSLPNLNLVTKNPAYVEFNNFLAFAPKSDDFPTLSYSLPDSLFPKTIHQTKPHTLNNPEKPINHLLAKSAPDKTQARIKTGIQKGSHQNQTTLQLWQYWQQQLIDSDYQQLPIIGSQIAERLRKQADEQIYQELYDLATSSYLSVEQKAIVVDLLSDVATPESLSLLVQLTEQVFNSPLYIFVLQAIGRVGDNRWDGKYHEELSGILEKEWSKPEVTDPNYIGVLAKAIASIGAPSGIRTLVNTVTGDTQKNANTLQKTGNLPKSDTTIKAANAENTPTTQVHTIDGSIPPNSETSALDLEMSIKNKPLPSNIDNTSPSPGKNSATIKPSTAQDELANTNIATNPNSADSANESVEQNATETDVNLEKQSQSINHLSSTTNPHALNELNNCLNNPISKPACSTAPALVNSIISRRKQAHLSYVNTATVSKLRAFESDRPAQPEDQAADFQSIQPE